MTEAQLAGSCLLQYRNLPLFSLSYPFGCLRLHGVIALDGVRGQKCPAGYPQVRAFAGVGGLSVAGPGFRSALLCERSPRESVAVWQQANQQKHILIRIW
jgi:hypothetical protein